MEIMEYIETLVDFITFYRDNNTRGNKLII